MALARYKTGLKRWEAPPRLRFSSYFKAEIALPSVPATFGMQPLFPPRTAANPYPMGILGNDILGNCTIAGPDHLVMRFNALAGRPVRLTTLDAEDDYRDCCGYVFGDPSTDNGGDIATVAQYWKTTGMRDWAPNRHKIIAYVVIEDPANNLPKLDFAAWAFDGGCGLGLALPPTAVDQFDAGQRWSGVAANEDDYHFVPYYGLDGQGQRWVYTWGGEQPTEPGFITSNVREAVAYITEESATNGKSASGFAIADLLSDIAAL